MNLDTELFQSQVSRPLHAIDREAAVFSRMAPHQRIDFSRKMCGVFIDETGAFEKEEAGTVANFFHKW